MRCILFFLLFLPIYLYGSISELNFDVIDYNNGLTTSSIRRITQDCDGVIWVATNAGVLTYDGYVFENLSSNYTNQQEKTSNYIYSLEDSPTYMWVGCEEGIFKINKSTKKVTKISGEAFDNVRVENITTAVDGRLWVASVIGAFLYDPEGKQPTERVFDRDVKRIIIDHQQRVWLATWSDGPIVLESDLNSYTGFDSLKNSDCKKCYNLFEDYDGNIWVAFATQGIAKVIETSDKWSLQFYKNKKDNSKSLASNATYCIAQEPNTGDIWVGTQLGISILKDRNDPYSFDNHTCYLEDNNKVFDDINWIYQDAAGTMWLASLYNGILKTNLSKTIIEHNSLENLKKDLLTSMVIDIAYIDDSTYYLNIKGRGIYYYNPKTGEYYSIEKILGEGFFYNTTQLKSLHYDPSRETLVFLSLLGDNYEVSLKDGVVVSGRLLNRQRKWNRNVDFLAIDNNGGKWINTSANIRLIREGKNDLYCSDLKDYNISAFKDDNNGRFWFGTEEGDILCLRIIKGKLDLVEKYHNEKMANYGVSSIFCDYEGDIWCTRLGGGLELYNADKNVFENVTEQYGIDDNILFNIFEGSDGKILMLSYNGLVCIDKDRSKSYTYPNSTFLKNHFDPATNISKVNDSIFLIGGVNGYNTLNINHLKRNNYIPNIIFSQIKSNDCQLMANSDYFQQIDSYEYELTLPKEKNDVEFTLSTLSYNDPKGNKFAYKLEGVDSDWKVVDASRRFASYTNLSKGKYTFYAKGANENQVWNEKPIVCHLTIQPAFYESWVAYVIYMLFTLAVFALIVNYIYDRIRLKNIILKAKLEKETDEKVNNLKLRLFTNVTHELLTPLSVIKCAIENISINGKTDEGLTSTININIDRLIRLVREVIEFRKAEAGNIVIKVSKDDLSANIENICKNGFYGLAKEKNIHFSFLKPKSPVVGYFDCDKIDKIIYNLLSNAIKYNVPGGYVLVSIVKEVNPEGQEVAVISVKDGGIGIAPENIEKIFTRFYDGDYRSTGTNGSGIGLSLTRELARHHLGDVKVISNEDKGSTFTVKIPLDKTSYTENNIEIIEPYKAPAIIVTDDTELQVPLEQMKQILIVEDNIDLQKVISLTLNSEYRIFQAYNGEEALEILASNNIDLIITDLMMPIMDGLEMCRRVKQDRSICHIPIIMLTAKLTEETRSQAYEIGANAFLAKPFSSKVLLSRISNLLASKESYVEYFKKDEASEVTTLTDNPIDDKIMNDIIAIIERNMDNADFSFIDVAQEVNMSKSTLYRKVKSITDMSPGDFIRNIRLKASKRMLKENSFINISEVAYKVGFNDPKYFSVCFKKEFGITPSQCQRQ